MSGNLRATSVPKIKSNYHYFYPFYNCLTNSPLCVVRYQMLRQTFFCTHVSSCHLPAAASTRRSNFSVKFLFQPWVVSPVSRTIYFIKYGEKTQLLHEHLFSKLFEDQLFQPRNFFSVTPTNKLSLPESKHCRWFQLKINICIYLINL